MSSTDEDEDISDVIKKTLNRFFRAGDPANKTTALYEEYGTDGDRVLHGTAKNMGKVIDYTEVESVEKQEEDIYEAALSPNSIISMDGRPIIYKKNKELHSRLVLCLRHNRSKLK